MGRRAEPKYLLRGVVKLQAASATSAPLPRSKPNYKRPSLAQGCKKASSRARALHYDYNDYSKREKVRRRQVTKRLPRQESLL